MRRHTILRLWAAVTLLSAPLSSKAVESPIGHALQELDSSTIVRRDAAAVRASAQAFLDRLDDDRKAVILLPFDTPEKRVWSNLPPNPDYAGLRLADLTPEQLDAAITFLATTLSPSGFEEVRSILQGDDLLVRGETAPSVGAMLFGADNYWLFFFGEPSTSEPWGWQLDGHHLALNGTLVGDQMTLSPSFIGTQPFHVNWASEPQTRPMSGEIGKAYQWIESLNAEQRQVAIQGPQRQNLDAGPGNDAVNPELVGLSGAQMETDQRDQALDWISEWLNYLPEHAANARRQSIRESLDATHFAWWGEAAAGSPVYFRIQGPRILIEFAHQNLGGAPLEHLHSVYRDPTNDYGATWVRDLGAP